MQKWEMKQIVPIKIAIYKKSIEENIIDLIFATTLLLENLISCGITKEFNHDFDYLPILLK